MGNHADRRIRPWMLLAGCGLLMLASFLTGTKWGQPPVEHMDCTYEAWENRSRLDAPDPFDWTVAQCVQDVTAGIYATETPTPAPTSPLGFDCSKFALDPSPVLIERDSDLSKLAIRRIDNARNLIFGCVPDGRDIAWLPEAMDNLADAADALLMLTSWLEEEETTP